MEITLLFDKNKLGCILYVLKIKILLIDLLLGIFIRKRASLPVLPNFFPQMALYVILTNLQNFKLLLM